MRQIFPYLLLPTLVLPYALGTFTGYFIGIINSIIIYWYYGRHPKSVSN